MLVVPWRWRLVRNQFGVVFVGLDQPNLAVLEVSQQPRILLRIEFARPENLGGIDFRPVVNPLVVNVVILVVAHKDEMFAGSVKEFFLNGRAAGISLAGPLQWVTLVVRSA